MTSSFTDGTTAVLPELVDGWSSTRTARTVIQPVIGGGVDAWMQPASPRNGSLTAVFSSLDDAVALETLLAAGTAITFSDSDHPTLSMTFAPTDDITVNQSDGRSAWLVRFGFQEVTA